MKTAMIRRIAWGILVLIGLGVESAWAQRYPERRVLRSGNKLYEKEQYAEAETQYRKAQDMNPTYEGLFNLADVLYKQKRYEEALNILKQIARDDVAGMHAPDAYYNLGNTYFQMKKLPEAAEAYKNTLRRNPNDDEARYNLAYVLELMKQNNNQNNNRITRTIRIRTTRTIIKIKTRIIRTIRIIKSSRPRRIRAMEIMINRIRTRIRTTIRIKTRTDSRIRIRTVRILRARIQNREMADLNPIG